MSVGSFDFIIRGGLSCRAGSNDQREKRVVMMTTVTMCRNVRMDEQMFAYSTACILI